MALELAARPCRRCRRPFDLHCPGCGTCDPDYTCPPTCDAEPEEVAAAAAAVEQWEEAQARKARLMIADDLAAIADHLITVLADDPAVTDRQLDDVVRRVYDREPQP
jgi:hypothetical protein